MTEARQDRQRATGRLHLLFSLAGDRYAIDVAEILEVLALRPLKQVPEAPCWIAGLFVHRGRPVPVVDLTARLTGIPAARRTSTRLAVIRYPSADGGDRALGLVLEGATETVRMPEQDFAATGLASGPAAYLGPVQEAQGLVQRIEVAGLLPDDVRALLFPAADTAGRP